MSDVKDIAPDLHKLEAQLGSLGDDLEPLLENLETMSTQLPLLDKAKLYSLTAYAIETMLFGAIPFSLPMSCAVVAEELKMSGNSIVAAARAGRAEACRLHGAQEDTAVFRQDQGGGGA